MVHRITGNRETPSLDGVCENDARTVRDGVRPPVGAHQCFEIVAAEIEDQSSEFFVGDRIEKRSDGRIGTFKESGAQCRTVDAEQALIPLVRHLVDVLAQRIAALSGEGRLEPAPVLDLDDMPSRFFAEAGWHVIEDKYGGSLETAFARKGGDSLRRHIDEMPNERYQSLFSVDGAALRSRFLEGADPAVRTFLDSVPDEELARLILNLGGHDLEALVRAYRRADAVTDRPSVVFAYTIKGWCLPIAGDPMNHSVLLSGAQVDDLRASLGLTAESEWDRFDPGSAAGKVCAAVGAGINNEPVPPRPAIPAPAASGAPQKPVTSSQEAFGRVLVQLGRNPELAERMVTVSPDVAVSTNLGGWINEQGVFSPTETVDYYAADRLLKWTPSPRGHHIELGISEMNLFLLLGQLGLSHEHHGEMLLPIGTVYDPFVLRGLDALIYSLYNDSRFIILSLIHI